jgi:serine phosphatase RsbU (regulator of sigma subunit)/anti-sigma regulatory factor (Ser/Thr protein kinase)
VTGDRWDEAPCGLLMLAGDGTVVDANRTVLAWLGRERGDLIGRARLEHLLSVGGRLYWETHLRPLLHVDGRFDEVALELVTPDGRLPVLMSAVAYRDDDQPASLIHVAVSSAWERSRYERELRAARETAEHSASQTRALQLATAALSGALGVEGVAAAVLAAAVGPLGAASATLWLADPDLGLDDGRCANEPPGAAPRPQLLELGGQRVASAQDARVVVPLHGQSSLRGVLSLAPVEGAAADPLDLEVLTAVGQQAGLALDRALLYEQSASVAHELQRSLLAVTPPTDTRFAVATTYRPGVELLEVGGDWYDVFLVEDDVLAVEVGDVVGRGLGAASAMGQLRSAVRAAAGVEAGEPSVGPARLLSRLDRFVDQVESAGMATLAYAELNLATGDLWYACAGHPPPLLLPARGEPRLLWEGRSTPLGAHVRPRLRPEARVRLREGDRLLLYTDGLIERRDRGLDEGLRLLTAAAGAGRTLSLEEAVRGLTTTMLRDEHTRDDVCVLLLSWTGAAFERRLPADLSTLSAVRRSLGNWLSRHGVDDLTRRDVVLAASEAMANAAEHGGGGRAGEVVRVQARLYRRPDGEEEVVLTVSDRGRWRQSQPSPERGRGLRIIQALADDLDVRHDDGTTVEVRRLLRRAQS